MRHHPQSAMAAAGAVVGMVLALSAIGLAMPAAGETGPAGRDPLARLDSLLASGRAEEAAAEAARLLALPDLAERFRMPVTQRRCVALQAAGRLPEALPVCENAVLLAATDPANHQNLATCLQKLGQLGRAAGELEQALELSPERTDWRLQYARILLDLGVQRESRRQIEMAAASCPGCPAVERASADHALRTGDPQRAIAPLTRLLQSEPSPQVRERLVQACWDADRLAAVDSVLADQPLESLSAYELKLWLQADRTRQIADRALRFAPGGADAPRLPAGARGDPQFWALVSEVCRLGADLEAALAAIDAALACAPEDGRWHQNRAAVLVKLGREQEATAALSRARALGGVQP